MGHFHFEIGLGLSWFDISNYVTIKLNYTASSKSQDYCLLKEVWPDVRKWVISDCDGDVVAEYGYNETVILYFEKKEDLMAFKLMWL